MLREKLMKNILLVGILSLILFIGCSSKTIEIVENEPEREVIMEVNDVKNKVELNVIEENIILEDDAVVENVDTPIEQELDEEKQKIELKKKLDEEALINSDKKLNAKEIKSYVIDENTPLILKNQSKDRAYE